MSEVYQDPAHPDCGQSDLNLANEALKEAQSELTQIAAEFQQVEADIMAAEVDIADANQRRRDDVSVTVDRKEYTVAKGRYLVSDLKKLVGVASDRELDLIKDGRLEPLADNSFIDICHHETFVSHVKTGGSA